MRWIPGALGRTTNECVGKVRAGVETEWEVAGAGTLAQIDSAIAMIVCDWNGTLIDDRDRACNATNRVLTGLGREPLDAPEFQAAFRLPLRAFFAALGIEAALLDQSVRAWNLFVSEERPRLSPGVRAFLTEATRAGVSVGVVSALDEVVVRADAAALRIDRSLAFVQGGVRDKAEAIRTLVDSAHAAVIYIGDTEYDIESARSGGAIAVAFSGGYRPAPALVLAGASAVIDSFAELIDLIVVRRLGN